MFVHFHERKRPVLDRKKNQRSGFAGRRMWGELSQLFRKSHNCRALGRGWKPCLCPGVAKPRYRESMVAVVQSGSSLARVRGDLHGKWWSLLGLLAGAT